MKLRAKYTNETLRILKGEVYEGCTMSHGSTTVSVRNDKGDSVLMSLYDFEEVE